MKLTLLKNYNKYKKRINKTSGRGTKGNITIRHRGGGSKRFMRSLNWAAPNNSLLLTGLVYSPKHSSMVYQFFNKNTRSFYFQRTSSKVNILDELKSSNDLYKRLMNFEVGESCNQIGSSDGMQKPKYILSDGAEGRVLQRYTWAKDYVLILLPSGEQKLFHKKSFASMGYRLNFSNVYESLKFAGRARRQGKRPKVRGVAMNPVDHPHGGGEGKTSGGRPSVNPRGLLTKSVKTRKSKRSNWQIFSGRKSK